MPGVTRRKKHDNLHVEGIYRRGEAWKISIDLPRDASGKRRRKWMTCHGSFEDAVLMKKEAENASKLKATETLEDYLKSWLRYKEGILRYQTLVRYESAFRSHIYPYFGPLSLGEIRKDQLREHFKRLERVLAVSTLTVTRTALARAFNDAIEDGKMSTNPAAFPVGRVKKRLYDLPKKDDVQKLLDAAVGSSVEPAVLLAVHAGMRRGEIMALAWGDIDFDKGTVRVDKNVVSSGGKHIDETKTESSRRVVVLPSAVVTRLREIYLAHDSEPMLPVCEGRDGYFCHTGFTKQYNKILKKAGVQIRFHDLRHFNASSMLAAGIPITIVQHRLGHSSIGVTAKTYTHTTEDMQRDWIKRYEEQKGGSL